MVTNRSHILFKTTFVMAFPPVQPAPNETRGTQSFSETGNKQMLLGKPK